MQPLAVTGALALLLAVGVALLVRGLAPLVCRGRSALWAAAVLAPVILATLAGLALLFPHIYSDTCHCALHDDAHPHLCWLHPNSASPFVAPALGLIGAWALLRGPGILRVGLSIVRSSWLARAVRATPILRIDGVAVRVLDCGEPAAFTVGSWSPCIVVDRSLAADLDDQSLRAVVHHEHAHALRRDGLTLALLQLVAACFPARLLRGAVAGWTYASEADCDGHAAEKLGSRADVAAALVRVARLRASCSPRNRPIQPAIASTDLDRRVRALLSDAPRPANLASDMISVAIVLAGLAVLATCWPGDSLHHAAETLLGHALSR